MQGKAEKHHALCMCETCDEEITNDKKWEDDKGSSNKEPEAHRHDPSPTKGQESITSLVTPSESKALLSEPPPPSDPGEDPDNPEWTGFSEKPKKYHFSGTVQDGNKGYFVGWYIEQKVGYNKLRGVRVTSPPLVIKSEMCKGRQVKKEIIEQTVKVKGQQDVNHYSPPIQMPYITNAMNHQPQPPYYHSTPAHNYGQSFDRVPKRDDQYFVNITQPPPHIIQPQRTSCPLNQPNSQPQNISMASQNPYNTSVIRPQDNSSSMEEANRNTTQNLSTVPQNSSMVQIYLQNATLQLAKTQSEMLNSLAQNQM